MFLKRSGLLNHSLIYYFDLISVLVSRELKILYKRSVLGIAWTLINPLLQLAVFSFVFQAILQVNIPHYGSYAFSGLLVWTWTQSSLIQATGLITNNRPLIRQPAFPVAILPVVTITTGLIHFMLAFPVLLLFLLIDGVSLTPSILLLPILLVVQFGLTVSLAYPLAAFNVTFRDTQHTVGVLLQLMSYLLPIFYAITQVPDRLKIIYAINPMVPLLDAYRDVLLEGRAPNLTALLGLFLATMVLLPLGYQIFRRQSDRFVEEI
jgi:lipopolysaccharide transport system permease protein